MSFSCKTVLLSLAIILCAGSAAPAYAQICIDESSASVDSVKSASSMKPRYTTKKRITFLWDVTLSMYGMRLGPDGTPIPALTSKDIYDKVQESIINQINSINNETVEIVVVPFQEGVLVDRNNLKDWTCVSATTENKAKLAQKIRDSKQYFFEYAPKHGAGTDILSSMKWVMDNVFDEKKTDVLYLLTDGGQGGKNVRGTQQDLENYINGDWAGFALSRNVQGFYLMLTQEAKQGLPSINQGVPLVTKDMSEVDEYPSSVDIQLKGVLSLNVKEKEDFQQEFLILPYEVVGGKLPQGSKLKVRICNNNYISLGKREDPLTRTVVVPFGERDLKIPFHFLKDQSTTIYELPEESNAMLYIEEFICESEAEQEMTMVTPARIPINLINKNQPAVRIRWAF